MPTRWAEARARNSRLSTIPASCVGNHPLLANSRSSNNSNDNNNIKEAVEVRMNTGQEYSVKP